MQREEFLGHLPQLQSSPSDNFGDPTKNGELRDEQDPVEMPPGKLSDYQ